MNNFRNNMQMQITVTTIISLLLAMILMVSNSSWGLAPEYPPAKVETLAKLTINNAVEIPIISFKWGGSSPVTGPGTAVGYFIYDKIILTHKVDQYSPALFQKFVKNGITSPLEIRMRTIDTHADFLKYTFPGVTVVGIKHNGTNNSFPVEEISLSYVSGCKGNDCPPSIQFTPIANLGTTG